MNPLPQRKNIRLKHYDYSQAGYYFITICTHKKQHLLSSIVGGGFHAAHTPFNTEPKIELTIIGKEILKTIEYIDTNYINVKFDKFVIMPNHIHFIVILGEIESKESSNLDRYCKDNGNLDAATGRRGNLPLQRVVGQLKSYTNRMYNAFNKREDLILWQRNYYEHIIRNDQEYEEIYEYIETNPLKWQEDKYFIDDP
ncbi:transposase [Clostridium grantii]|uniref:REP element-mobilizing transposase RayT n=1 Tax=Clostridium grantii DSM 8605 TaxID=1121316 RepID=A0A1M5UTT1_9CLOT|nr:transposase [Clostridium grantii]SHH66399.1 REP element-mobilizing transposase RayT [Clostridium grantii DSM 8605]